MIGISQSLVVIFGIVRIACIGRDAKATVSKKMDGNPRNRIDRDRAFFWSNDFWYGWKRNIL